MASHNVVYPMFRRADPHREQILDIICIAQGKSRSESVRGYLDHALLYTEGMNLGQGTVAFADGNLDMTYGADPILIVGKQEERAHIREVLCMWTFRLVMGGILLAVVVGCLICLWRIEK